MHAASLIILPRNVLVVTKERVVELRMAVVEQAAVPLPAVAVARSQRLDTSPSATPKRTTDNADRRPSHWRSLFRGNSDRSYHRCSSRFRSGGECAGSDVMAAIGVTEKDLHQSSFDLVMADRRTPLHSIGQRDLMISYGGKCVPMTIMFCPEIRGMLICRLDCVNDGRTRFSLQFQTPCVL